MRPPEPSGGAPERSGRPRLVRRAQRLPLRARAAIGYGFTALVISSVLAVATYALVRSNLIDQRESAARRQAYTNARLLRARLDPRPDDVSQLLAGLQVGPDGEAVLGVADQWYSSSLDIDRTQIPRSLQDALEQGEAASQKYAGSDGTMLAVGVPIVAGDARYYEITSFAEVESTLDTLARALFIGAASASLTGALVGLSLSRVVLQPLRETATVARQIVAGDGGSRLSHRGDPDLAPLAGAFNEMLDELDGRIRRESRFASDVTHELRGPLTALAAAVNVVNRRRDQLPDEAVAAVDALDEQVESFNGLVLDLLDISRFDAGTAELDLREVDVTALCRAVVAESASPDLPVRTLGGRPLRARVDPRRMRQVVSNLLENAERYAGGPVAVTVRPAAPGRVAIEVDDAGPGVGPDEREVIFGRFARGVAGTVPGAPRGSGLGLALCREHVQLHGGTLTVGDRPTGGARFRIEIPEARAPGPQAATALAPPAEARPEGSP